jgi:hypothetical protein
MKREARLGIAVFASATVLSALAGAQDAAPPPVERAEPAPPAPAASEPAGTLPAPAAGVPAPPAAAAPQSEVVMPPAGAADEPRPSPGVPDAPVAPPARVVEPAPLLSEPAPAYAMDPELDSIDWAKQPLGAHQRHIFMMLGARFGANPNAGFDAYAEDDFFPQLSAGLGAVLYAEGPLSVAGALGWDFGQSEEAARGETASLSAHRFFLGPEARLHVIPRLYGFARVSPGATFVKASLTNGVAGGLELGASNWMFALDALAGAAFEVAGSPNGERRSGRMWVFAEGGYSYTTAGSMEFSAPDEDDADASAPARANPESLGDLAFRGPVIRIGVLVGL